MEKAIQFHVHANQPCELTTEQIVDFLENFRLLVLGTKGGRSKLISIKIPESLLAAFRTKAASEGVPYQTKIKDLMMDWVKDT